MTRWDSLTHPGRYGSEAEGRDQRPRDFSLPFRGHGGRIAGSSAPLPVGSRARHPPAMLWERGRWLNPSPEMRVEG
eukprot:1143043-Prymnesium_polylepis.1